jgi:succinate dehydrogenase / fumarate reductase flavoprotein subunit
MTKDLKIHSTIHCDLLVIGVGGAGFRSAVEVLEKRPETRVLAITKGAHPQKSHTSTAQGGLAAVDPRDPVDRPIFHMFDTWKGSDCTADQNVIKKISEASWDEIIWLENRGMHFSRNPDGKLSKRTFGGHTVNFGGASAYRAVFESDRTGKGIMDTAWGEAIKRNISFLNKTLATELIIKDNRCIGAVVFLENQGRFARVLSRATIIATGGSGQVFKVTTNCRQNTGDGLAIALQAGLPVMDAEAVQFHPTGIVGPGILASETLRSVGGILRNKDLEPFMERYAPKMKELAPRDLVARAIESEIRQGRGIVNPDHNIPHVWIDLTHLPQSVHDKQIPEVTGFFKKYVSLDPKTQLCPVRPSNHYHMGGIPTDEFGQVQTASGQKVDGLYAVGECAAASFHGFNRLGTNSILELITMGKFVGRQALTYLNEAGSEMPEAASEVASFESFARYLEATGKDSIGKIRNELRTLMTEKVGVFRTGQELASAANEIKGFKERADETALAGKSLTMNQELVQRWELDNLLALSLIITESALKRRESRGAHYRDDYPNRRDEFDYHTLASMREFARIEFGQRDVDMSVYEAGGENSEYFDMIERNY